MGGARYVAVGGQGLTGSTSAIDRAGGWNGGGIGEGYSNDRGGGSGGGATHIASATGTLASLNGNKSAVLIVAGAGGGGGPDSSDSGGAGGGLTGENAVGGSPGTGGTQLAGGSGDSISFGSFGQGDNAQSNTGNGGGGGGYYGGGAGRYDAAGGGSSYIGGVSNGVTIAGSSSMSAPGGGTQTGQSGNGYARIISPGGTAFTGGTQTGSFTISGNIDVATLETASQSFDITIGQSGASAIGSNTTFNNTGVLTLGSSAVGQSLTVTGTLTASAQSTINVAGSITSTGTQTYGVVNVADDTELNINSGTFIFTTVDGENTLTLKSSSDLTINNAISTVTALSDLVIGSSDNSNDITISQTITTNGNISVLATDVTLNADITVAAGKDAVISATGNFDNNANSDAINGAGQWFVYAADKTNSSFGTDLSDTDTLLNSNNNAIWGQTYVDDHNDIVTNNTTGNYYIFAENEPLVVLFKTSNGGKTYGRTGDVSQNYQIVATSTGIEGVFTGTISNAGDLEASDIFTVNPTITSLGTPDSAGVSDAIRTYDIVITNANKGTPKAGYTVYYPQDPGYTDVEWGTFTVDPSPIQITLLNQTIIYGESPNLTAALDTTYSVTSGTLYGTDILTGSLTASGSDAGTHNLTKGTLANSNYDITFVNGTLTINKKPINITADDKSKTYGDNNPALTYTVTQDLSNLTPLSGSVVTTATATTNVGTVDITQGTLTNANNSNYDITFVNGTLTINKKPINITADDKSKTYGDNNPALTYTVTQDLSNLTPLSGSVVTTATATTNVGTVDITQGTLTNANNSNYDITFVNGTLTINKKPINITADDKSKTYGDNNPALTYTVTQDLSNLTPLSGSVVTTATATTNVGTVDITQGTLTNANNSNYDITFVNGTLTINKKPINITADDKSKTYGDNNPALTYTVTQDLSNLTPLSGSVVTTATATTNVGTVDITQGTLTNANNSNYDITFVNGTLTINKKPINITADDKSKTYGDNNPALTYTVTQDLSNLTPLSGSVVTTATATTNVGTVDITQGTLTNANNSNYDITFVNGTLTINKKPINITADDKSKTYGDNNPALTYTVTQDLSNLTPLSGSVVTTATATTNVGTVDITQGTLTNANNSNYDITFVNGTLTINKANLTVTGENQTITYGESPNLTAALDTTYSVTSGTLYGTDILTGSLAASGSDAGTHNLTKGTLANSNYDITFVNGTLTINKKPINITADDKSKTYGDE
jgi:hypothetical protein